MHSRISSASAGWKLDLQKSSTGVEASVAYRVSTAAAAVRDLGLKGVYRLGGMQANNRTENGHLPIRRRERKQQEFHSQGSAQGFLPTRDAIYNTLNVQD